MDNVSRRDALSLDGNRRGNHLIGAVSPAKKSEMVDPVQQRDNGFHRFRVRERAQRSFQLCRFDGQPENIGRRNFSGVRNGSRKTSKWTLEMKLFGIIRESLAPYHHGDRRARSRQASADQAADSACSKDRMS